MAFPFLVGVYLDLQCNYNPLNRIIVNNDSLTRGLSPACFIWTMRAVTCQEHFLFMDYVL
ncbi:MAG: hypothetical protein A2W28_00505 [Gammaproteobacteria bacterium RBG_16_51_14]|nr:MAG: hypothetical protein A2W28_00505 [Gammaproteobacteria bacterium RBG_16_51_14]